MHNAPITSQHDHHLPATTVPGLAIAPTVLALGTAEFGSVISVDDSFRLLDRYAELGGNHFDSAHIYAAWLPNGTGASERTLGAWVRRRGLEGRVCIATKGAHFLLDKAQAPRVRPECIAADLRESLERLGLARVDIYYLHRDDVTVPVEPLLEALERERRAGLIGAYAASNWSMPRLAEAWTVARARGWAGFVANQVEWSLATVAAEGACGPGSRAADPALRTWHRESGIPLAAYSSQARGFFSREWSWPLPSGDLGKFARFASEGNVRRWRRVADRAAERGISRNCLALAWLLNQPQTVWPIVGCRTCAQIDDSMAAAAIHLSSAEIADLDGG